MGQIYCWFKSFFGDNLSYFLWGFDPTTQAYTNPNLYNFVGVIIISVSLLIVVGYYYIFNNPRYSKWWSWFIVLGLNSLIALFVGYAIVRSKYINGFIPNGLVYEMDTNGNILSQLIGDSNCWGFGFANFFVAAIFYIALSFLLKWWSSSAKHVPF